MRSFSIITAILLLTFASCKTEKVAEEIPDIAAIENGLLPALLVKGDSIVKFNILQRMEHYKVPGVSIAIVENGEIRGAKGYGISNTECGSRVDTSTLFQAASISKPLAALMALKLVEQGKLDLDQDVNLYLQDWKIPENQFCRQEKVTLRRLLTHTSGLNVHGFPGYKQTDSFPSLTGVLNGEGNTARILVDTVPGSIWRYSGGGYTVMEKLLEDVSGLPFDEQMAIHILQPLGMKNSTFTQPLGPEHFFHASAAYDREGNILEGHWHNYPERAAAGLWTTPTDLAKYCIEVQQIVAGKQNGILSGQTIGKMLTKHQNEWGLGPGLHWEDDSLIFRHGGKNAGFTNNLISFAHRGSALVVMTNADNGGKLIEEITRAVSSYYNWGIMEPRFVEIATPGDEKLRQLAGRYLPAFQVADPGEFTLDIEAKDNSLLLTQAGRQEPVVLTPVDELKFVDLESGDEVVFQMGDKPGMLWNNRFPFQKK